MDEHSLHVHRCPCGTAWHCEKADCTLDDTCTACDRADFERYAEHAGWTVSQPTLPELTKG